MKLSLGLALFSHFSIPGKAIKSVNINRLLDGVQNRLLNVSSTAVVLKGERINTNEKVAFLDWIQAWEEDSLMPFSVLLH